VEQAAGAQGLGWLMFISDHGETLFDGQCGRAGHGFASRPNFRPAAFFWPASGYAAQRAQRVAQLRHNAVLPTDYRTVFHTLLDLADIHVPVFDATLSMDSPAFQARQGRLIDAETGGVIDFDRQLPAFDCAQPADPEDRRAD
ncbi:MAG: hypothetical protein QM617_12215, partial [Comamonas sp.]